MKIIITPEAHGQICSIAQSNGSRAMEEAAKTYALLETIQCNISVESDSSWDEFKKSDSRIRFVSTLKGNIPIWQLHPDYTYCSALIVEANGDIHVLSFCSKAALSTTLKRLIDTVTFCSG